MAQTKKQKMLAEKLGRAAQPAAQWRFVLLAWALVVVISAFDYVASYEIALRFFYCVPLIIMVLIFQRAIVSGLTAGGVKG